MSDSLQPHGLHHSTPCPSPTPGVYSNSCPLSWWCHPTISSCHPLFLLPSIFPSIRFFSSDWVLPIRWSKYQSFSFSISPSNEYSVMISFRMDWLDLLAVQGTVKSFLQHNSKPSQRNNFSKPRLLHLLIHKRALKVNLWHLVSCVWIAIIFECSLHIFFFQEKFLAPSLPLLNSPSELSERLPSQVIILSKAANKT